MTTTGRSRGHFSCAFSFPAKVSPRQESPPLEPAPGEDELEFENEPASELVADVSRALYYRYLKRITAHVMNFLTSLVMPVDRLDYYDEEKEDRA